MPQDPKTPFEALNEPGRQLGRSKLLHEIGKWKFLPQGSPGEVEIAADKLGLHLVARLDDNPWGTYYGPFASGVRHDGTEQTFPDLKELTPDLVDVWSAHARDSKNAFLRHRYADLVWDLSKLLTRKAASVEYARMAIDAGVETLASNGVEHEVEGYQIAERILDLSKRLRDTARQRAAEKAFVDYEDKHAEDLHTGTWGRAFDSFVLTGDALDPPLQDRLIAQMEARLERVSTFGSKSFDPFGAEAAAMRLASLYRKQNKHAEMQRVLLTYRDAFVAASGIASGMVASAWIDRVHVALTAHGLTAEAHALEPLLREHGKRSVEEMKPMGVTISIPAEKIDQAYASLTSGSKEDSLLRLAAGFLPRKDELEKQIRDLAARAPLLARIQIVPADEEGRKVVSIGSVETDPDGRLVHHASEYLRMAAPFMRAVMSRAIPQLPIDLDLLMSQVRLSPVFVESRYPLIQAGLRALLSGQHVEAAHVLIPQIEYALRHLAELSGVSTVRRNKDGGLDARTLDDLLARLNAVAGEETTLYLRVLLSDKRGWNLRNEVCHGLLPAEAFNAVMSDRVLHVMLLLTAIRPATKPEDSAPSKP